VTYEIHITDGQSSAKTGGKILTAQGLDAIDGTPVLDIKPAMKEFLPRGEVV